MKELTYVQKLEERINTLKAEVDRLSTENAILKLEIEQLESEVCCCGLFSF